MATDAQVRSGWKFERWPFTPLPSRTDHQLLPFTDDQGRPRCKVCLGRYFLNAATLTFECVPLERVGANDGPHPKSSVTDEASEPNNQQPRNVGETDGFADG